MMQHLDGAADVKLALSLSVLLLQGLRGPQGEQGEIGAKGPPVQH